MDSLRLRPFAGVNSSRIINGGKWLGVLVFALPFICNAETLTEEKSLKLGLNQADFVNLLESRVDTARGAFETAKTWSNPEFEYTHEELGEETETNIWLRQSFDVSGRRSFSRDAAQADINAAQAGNDSARIKRSITIRKYFIEALYYQQQRQLLEHWMKKYTKVEAAMRKREEAGDVSGYDRLRISREKVSILAQQRHNQTSYQAAWQKLIGIIGVKDSKTFDGVMGELPPTDLPPISTVLDGLTQQPELLQLQHQANAARLAIRAADRSKMPEITLGVGHKSLDGPIADESGLMLTASIPVPLLDRKQGARLSASSKVRQAESEYQLLLNQMKAHARGLWYQANQLAENAQLFREQSVNASFELVRIAETAYDSNEIGVLELIDAYHSALEAEMMALKLALEARLTRIDLDRVFKGASL